MRESGGESDLLRYDSHIIMGNTGEEEDSSICVVEIQLLLFFTGLFV